MSSPTNTGADPASLSRGRVLLVDDEQPLLTSYGRILRGGGFSVEELSDARAVDGALERGGFDLVMSDIGMPGMDGIEVLQAVRRRDPDLPVVLMTGGADLATAVNAVRYGALRYFLKPVEPAALHQIAEEAVRLRQSTRAKKRAFELYEHVERETAERAALRERFDRAQATLHMAYQPIIRWSDRSIFAHEALVRTGEPTLRRPDHLLAAAETLGRLDELGRAIRASVAASIRATASRDAVFVNLHPQELQDDELFGAASPLSRVAGRVVLEITERASVGSIGDLQARLEILRRLGYRLAIDDLGAGFSGLSCFAQLKPEVVKLDMSLVRGVERDGTKQKLIQAMTALCGQLGMLVIIEGVETVAERDMVVGLGGDLLQGYLFAQPSPTFPSVAWHAT
jgi:EAL domain-containing protein (putative c-di-GMP-specific phosphodiesterase class I)